MSNNKLYNIGAYGIPQYVRLTVVDWRIDRLRWSNHAIREAAKLLKNNLLRECHCPASFSGDDELWTLVEVETNNLGHPVKIVVRRPIALEAFNYDWSLVLVITNDGIVKTCWVNLNTDNHRTLDKSKYSKP